MLYRWGCMLGIICSSLFFSTFLLSRHLDKGSYLSHRCINSSKTLLAHLCCRSIFGAGQRFASCCVASVILCQSLLRTVDCQNIAPAFWKLLLLLQTRLFGFIFIAFLICLSSTTVVFSAIYIYICVYIYIYIYVQYVLSLFSFSAWSPDLVFSLVFDCSSV